MERLHATVIGYYRGAVEMVQRIRHYDGHEDALAPQLRLTATPEDDRDGLSPVVSLLVRGEMALLGSARQTRAFANDMRGAACWVGGELGQMLQQGATLFAEYAKQKDLQASPIPKGVTWCSCWYLLLLVEKALRDRGAIAAEMWERSADGQQLWGPNYAEFLSVLAILRTLKLLDRLMACRGVDVDALQEARSALIGLWGTLPLADCGEDGIRPATGEAPPSDVVVCRQILTQVLKPGCELTIPDNAHGDDAFVALELSESEGTVLGYIMGRDAKRPEWLVVSPGDEVYSVPRSALQPLSPDGLQQRLS